MPHLLDTNVAIRLRDGEPEALRRLNALPEPLLSVVTVVELESGVYADPALAQQRRKYLQSFLATIDVVPFDLDAAAAYGQIVEQLGYSRRQVLDRMIAATALVRGATVVTSSTSDFQSIKGLQLQRW